MPRGHHGGREDGAILHEIVVLLVLAASRTGPGASTTFPLQVQGFWPLFGGPKRISREWCAFYINFYKFQDAEHPKNSTFTEAPDDL